jgi:hypothetical protein
MRLKNVRRRAVRNPNLRTKETKKTKPNSIRNVKNQKKEVKEMVNKGISIPDLSKKHKGGSHKWLLR